MDKIFWLLLGLVATISLLYYAGNELKENVKNKEYLLIVANILLLIIAPCMFLHYLFLIYT